MEAATYLVYWEWLISHKKRENLLASTVAAKY